MSCGAIPEWVSMSCGAIWCCWPTTWCGATTWCGVIPRRAASTWCGATTSSGATLHRRVNWWPSRSMERSKDMKTATFCLVFLAALPCAAGNKKISADLSVTNGDPNAQTTVMVQFDSDMSDQDSADVAKKGGKLKVKLGSVAAFSVPVSSILDVAALPNVAYVSPDRAVHGQLNYTTAAVNAGIAWKYGGTGDGTAEGRV